MARKPTVSLLRKTDDGSIVMKIDSADVDDLRKMGWRPPKVFTATARDGKTTIYGTLWKPTNFNPHHRYPVIDFTYTGPQMFLFNNTFTKTVLHSYDQYSPYYPSAQALAELGFIVIEVDGLGSAGRSKAFHDWSYEDLGNNLKGHVLAIKQLGRKYSWIDTTRVGIYGHSAGGYDAAHALEAFNKTYKVAVSESADHDWRMEKASWPELYVGWPVGENYRKQNNIAMAPELKGDLLLIHGGLDQNVNPSATFRLSEALIKAGKYFDELIIPSAHHHYLKYHAYVTKKRWHFFVRHLIVEPPE
jgi:dipeptidyl aminopeptidase/acylaminoacyl peptidase